MNDSENLRRNLGPGTGWRYTETAAAEEAEAALLRWPRLQEALRLRHADTPATPSDDTSSHG